MRKTPREVLNDLIPDLSLSDVQAVKEDQAVYGIGWASITLVIDGHEYKLECRDDV